MKFQNPGMHGSVTNGRTDAQPETNTPRQLLRGVCVCVCVVGCGRGGVEGNRGDCGTGVRISIAKPTHSYTWPLKKPIHILDCPIC